MIIAFQIGLSLLGNAALAIEWEDKKSAPNIKLRDSDTEYQIKKFHEYKINVKEQNLYKTDSFKYSRDLKKIDECIIEERFNRFGYGFISLQSRDVELRSRLWEFNEKARDGNFNAMDEVAESFGEHRKFTFLKVYAHWMFAKLGYFPTFRREIFENAAQKNQTISDDSIVDTKFEASFKISILEAIKELEQTQMAYKTYAKYLMQIIPGANIKLKESAEVPELEKIVLRISDLSNLVQRERELRMDLQRLENAIEIHISNTNFLYLNTDTKACEVKLQ